MQEKEAASALHPADSSLIRQLVDLCLSRESLVRVLSIPWGGNWHVFGEMKMDRPVDQGT